MTEKSRDPDGVDRPDPSIPTRGALPSLPRAEALGLVFRYMQPEADLPFLFRLYASTREEELAPVPWSAEQKASFLAQQFQAQHSHYMQHFPQAEWLVIEFDSQPVGRLYLDTRETELRIIDIALMPAQRGRGSGRAILEDVLALAERGGRGVGIHVEQFNPAMRLYQRLGFVTCGETGVYHLMRWDPPGPQ
ncbi:GNAT family N-acetyltransferase [Stappia indica]|uniref:GNAT family N-acetyltransferase n=1 Tax=Stappia indica TaxID=538381 RepID=A0A857CAL8_9HYPH|nr:GNAT family N-acetyltransferase [Stappia indica]QGZ35897.1 GNAT family N-acetyltransferase [Stappia indica]